MVVEDSAAVVVVVAAAAVVAADGTSASKAVVEFVVGTDIVADFVIAAVVGEQPAALLEFVSGNQQTYFACWNFG